MNSSLKALIKRIVPERIINYRRESILNKQRERFHRSCKELLELIDDVFRKEGITYWLTYGTLLGAYRDHDFIVHDYDLDIAVLGNDYERIKNLMLSKGMKLKNEFRFGSWESPENIEYRFEYKGAYVDFNFYYVIDDKAYTFCPYFIDNTEHTLNKKIRVIAELIENPFKGVTEYDFLNKKYFVPINTEDYIIANYGKDYRTPIKNFDYHKYATNIHPYGIDEKPSYMYIYY